MHIHTSDDVTDSSTRPPNSLEEQDDPAGARPMALQDIQAAYDERADWFHRFEWIERQLTGRYRRRLFEGIDGEVLDVACGTGTNFPYFASTAALTGIDLSPEMLEKARGRLADLGLDGQVHQMDAQALAFDDDRFDTVVSALSTCTFPEPLVALDEMQRVCAPDGRVLLLEHGRSDARPLAWYQDWRAESHYEKMGCRWNQEPLDLVESAGLELETATTAFFGIITMIAARPG